jgi:hypothetical protein
MPRATRAVESERPTGAEGPGTARPPRATRALARASLALALALVAACALEDSPPPAAAAFDGDRAFSDLVDLVAIGPRPAGSGGAERARRLIGDRLRQAGLRVEIRPFTIESPSGESVEMANVVGVLEGEREERILLVTHYDTKRIPGIRFVGANDGASGVALLLEVARQFGPRKLPFTLWLVFCDGEEAFGRTIAAGDGLYGSTALARELEREGELDHIRALILVDMVADADLNLTHDLGSSTRLQHLLRRVARDAGLESALDPHTRVPVVDDHTPFARLGVEPVLALIDFEFGARSIPGPYWHTEHDDLDSVSAESLNTVGTLAVELIERINSDFVAKTGRSAVPQRDPAL